MTTDVSQNHKEEAEEAFPYDHQNVFDECRGYTHISYPQQRYDLNDNGNTSSNFNSNYNGDQSCEPAYFN